MRGLPHRPARGRGADRGRPAGPFRGARPRHPEHSAQRLRILQEQEERLHRRRAELDEDLRVMRHKMADFRDLMAHGRTCEDDDLPDDCGGPPSPR
ncbi:hypothetical protein TPA0908_07460 [Micromonospora sp. AKA38]|nr:hypothetical protein TPA0908_00090 [Micromonospora sp. AKA38]GHJ12751.1 hypothetical protein TPA0908_07460 [Micromonospora sp. AKA38]